MNTLPVSLSLSPLLPRLGEKRDKKKKPVQESIQIPVSLLATTEDLSMDPREKKEIPTERKRTVWHRGLFSFSRYLDSSMLLSGRLLLSA